MKKLRGLEVVLLFAGAFISIGPSYWKIIGFSMLFAGFFLLLFLLGKEAEDKEKTLGEPISDKELNEVIDEIKRREINAKN